MENDITKEKVKEVVRICETCINFKKNQKFRQYPTNIDGEFLRGGGIDCIGPLPKSTLGCKFIVLATDYYTKWTEGKALKSRSAKEITRFLVEDVFSRHGVVKEIRSDQGLEFLNELVRYVAAFWNTKIKHSSPIFHNQTNWRKGQTRRS